jgi:hypothetical protein
VVEKWDSSKIPGAKRGGKSKGKQGAAKLERLHDSKGGHIPYAGCRSEDAASSIRLRCGHAAYRSSGFSPDTDGGALEVDSGGQERQAFEDVQLIKRSLHLATGNACTFAANQG